MLDLVTYQGIYEMHHLMPPAGRATAKYNFFNSTTFFFFLICCMLGFALVSFGSLAKQAKLRYINPPEASTLFLCYLLSSFF